MGTVSTAAETIQSQTERVVGEMRRNNAIKSRQPWNTAFIHLQAKENLELSNDGETGEMKLNAPQK